MLPRRALPFTPVTFRTPPGGSVRTRSVHSTTFWSNPFMYPLVSYSVFITENMEQAWPTLVESAALATPKKGNKRGKATRETPPSGREVKHASRMNVLTKEALENHEHLTKNLVTP